MTDRRIKKNKDALKKSLLILLRKQDIEKITVTELCDLADINRSTFYYHYKYIEELLYDVHVEILKELDKLMILPDKVTQPLDNKEKLIQLLDTIKNQNTDLSVVITGSQKELFVQSAQKYYGERFYKDIDLDSNRYIFIFNQMGTISIINQWISDNYPCSAEVIANLIYNLTVANWSCINSSVLSKSGAKQ